MDAYFFTNSLDYLLFCAGLVLLTGTMDAVRISRTRERARGWLWMAGYCFTTALLAWGLASSLGVPVLEWMVDLRHVLWTMTHLLLVFWLLDTWYTLRGKTLNLLTCLGVAAAYSLVATIGLGAFLQHVGPVLAVITTLLGAVTLHRLLPARTPSDSRVAAITLLAMLFAAVGGYSISLPGPSGLVTVDKVLGVTNTGFPLAALWSALAILLGVSVCGYGHVMAQADVVQRTRNSFATYQSWLGIVIPAMLVIGWVVTTLAGATGDYLFRARLQERARSIAAAVNPYRVAALKGVRSDTKSPHYDRLRWQLREMVEATPELRHAYLVVKRHSDVVFLVDSEPLQSAAASLPGDVYSGGSERLRNVFSDGRSMVDGPLPNRWGLWVSAFAPVYSEFGETVLAVAGVDQEAENWLQEVGRYRVATMVLILLFCLLVIVFTIATFDTRLGRRMAEASAERFRAIFEGAPEAVVLLDAADGSIVEANPASGRLLGTPAQELRGRPLGLHPRPTATLPAGVAEGLDVQQVDAANGLRLDVAVTSAPMWYGGRSVDAVFLRDISDALRAVEALQVRERYLQSLAIVSRALIEQEAEPVGLSVLQPLGEVSGALCAAVFAVDAAGQYTCTHYWQADLGLSVRHPASGQTPDDVLRLLAEGQTITLTDGQIARLLCENQAEQGELVLIAPLMVGGGLRGMLVFLRTADAGEWMPIELDMLDAAARAISIAMDRSRLSKERDRMLEDLRTANRELEQLIHAVSHDLKSPVRAVGSLADWLKVDYGNCLDAKGRETLDMLVARVRRLYRLMDSLFEYSRIGRVRERVTNIDLSELVRELLAQIMPDSVQVDIEPLPVVRAELDWMDKLFGSLLDNAITYADPDAPRVRIECWADGDRWRFAISDNGPGIAPRHRARVLELFSMLERHDDSDHLGVGLAIARRVLHHYGGDLVLGDAEGGGLRVEFDLPA